MDKHKDEIKKYGMLHEYHDSEDFLMKNPHLTCEDTANYLVVWSIDLEVEEARKRLSLFCFLMQESGKYVEISQPLFVQ